jgi:serpin B
MGNSGADGTVVQAMAHFACRMSGDGEDMGQRADSRRLWHRLRAVSVCASLSLLVAWSFSACKDKSELPASSTTPTPTQALPHVATATGSALPRESAAPLEQVSQILREARAPDPVQLDEKSRTRLARSHATFALSVWRRLVEQQPERNLVSSPLNLQLAFALEMATAKAAARKRIARLLSGDLPPELLEQGLAAWVNELQGAAGELQEQAGLPRPMLRLANAVWLDSSLKPDSIALDRLQSRFGAAVRHAAISLWPAVITQEINQWVSEATMGRIPHLIDSLSSQDFAVYVSAAYLRAAFVQPFSAPFLDDFFTTSNQPLRRQFVDNRARYTIAQERTYQAVAMELSIPKTQLVLIMPRAGSLSAFIRTFGLAQWTRLMQRLSEPGRKVQLSWPVFEVRQRFENARELLGPAAAGELAPTNVFGKRGASQLVHEATLKADQKGLEGAAATAVSSHIISGSRTAPEPFVILTFNHPFLYAVVERETGAILFMGQVVLP